MCSCFCFPFAERKQIKTNRVKFNIFKVQGASSDAVNTSDLLSGSCKSFYSSLRTCYQECSFVLEERQSRRGSALSFRRTRISSCSWRARGTLKCFCQTNLVSSPGSSLSEPCCHLLSSISFHCWVRKSAALGRERKLQKKRDKEGKKAYPLTHYFAYFCLFCLRPPGAWN